MTIEEWMEVRKNDPQWLATQERLKHEDRKRAAWAKVLRNQATPLVAELRAAGFEVESVWDLFNRKEPWRKDVPIPAYTEAMPILVRHLKLPYHFTTREGIVRALTDREARFAFDDLVEEFRRTRDTGEEEKRRAVELMVSGVGDLYEREEVEYLTARDWESYRFALANAIGFLFQKEHIPLILELLRDRGHGDSPRQTLVEYLRKKMRRWRRADPQVLEVLEELAGEEGYVGEEARKALEVLRKG